MWRLKAISSAYFLLSLQTINDRRELAQNLVGLLVVLHLSRDQLREVPEGFRGIQDLGKLASNFNGSIPPLAYVLHDTNGFFRLSDKFVLGLLNFFLGFGAELRLLTLAPRVAQLEGCALGGGFDRIEREPRVLYILAGSSSELKVGVEGRVPTGQEAALDLRVLGETCLANALLGKRDLLKSGCKRVFAGPSMVLMQELTARQTGAGERVAEGLGLRLRGRGCDERSLCLGRRRG